MPSRRHITRRAGIAFATGLAALVTAPAAFGATAEVTGDTVVYDLDLTNPFAQDLKIEFKEDRYVFTESGSEPRALLRANTGCRKDDGKVLSCNGAGIAKVRVATENLDDVVTVGEGVTVPVEFTMGQGGDEATGGPAADIFNGGLVQGLGNDTFEGKAGDDKFVAGPNADVMKGGEGVDTFDLSARALRQNVSLDNEPNDGDPTDLASLDTAALSGADNAQTIEAVIGGSVKDTLTGDDGANTLDGRNGADTIEGRGGADTLIGDNGNDEILARSSAGGVLDADKQISCGGGQDRVTADSEDGPAIAADCEDVDCGNCELPPPDPDGAGPQPAPPSPAPEIAAVDPPGGDNDKDEGAGSGGGGTPPDPDGAGPQQAAPPLPPQVEIVSDGVVPLSSRGKVPVRIVCIYRADRCAGSLTLKTKTAIKAKVGRKVRTIKKGTTIGKANLEPIRWGNSAPVPISASKDFRAILPLLRKPSTKVTATLVTQDTAGGAGAPEATATGDLTVAAKAKRKRK